MNPELRIFHDFQKLSRHAANLFIEQSNRAFIERDRFLGALNGGNTPTRLFQLLATEYRDQVEWSKVHVFWGDERCVPPDDPGSNYGQARDLLLSRVPILDSNIYRVKTDLDPAEASRDYSLTLSGFASPPLDVPRFDLVYLAVCRRAVFRDVKRQFAPLRTRSFKGFLGGLSVLRGKKMMRIEFSDSLLALPKQLPQPLSPTLLKHFHHLLRFTELLDQAVHVLHFHARAGSDAPSA